MKKVTASGKTVEEAVEKALAELNTTKERVDIHVVEEPQKGFFGFIGSKPAIVEVEMKRDAIEESVQFLQELIHKMDVQASVTKQEEDDTIVLNLEGKNLGTVIGKRGQTLDSLQYLVNLVANRYSEQYIRIQLDAEQYRKRRKEALEQLALRLANKAKYSKQAVKLEPMQAHERKIIHAALQKIEGVKTISEGHEPRRRIVITPQI
ncbi:RNA-binding cell elongation regulator Jag/EloR [Alkalihalobacillus sp. LMS39]|uniref:RNA-binding cell elongation regulator Jag/EloR n=1 Tax=Alkalihalobacillus sp. LMS39 TaxID=2924032 RepID=UPI001FB3DEB1|nr:RNA-binding cell elongation regulator Jag/EloR [Alkalihalobacillus sp. LMS39]UOE94139.1 protein jag [Alkalihalobacillus sp. LMS39]